MTLINGEKYVQSKWKNGETDKPRTVLTLRISALLVAFIAVTVLLKFLVVLTGKPITLILNDTGMDMLTKVQFTSNWLSENCSYLLWPSIKGLLWTVSSWTLLYLDSDAPGVNPPPTLSPRKTRFSSSVHHIGYLTSLSIGLVVFSLNLWNEL